MISKKIILVTGATGAQGGSVAKALLNENKFAVRILTRNAKSPKALALQEAGAEIAEGDLDDIQSLLTAMKDVYGVFGVTSFWEHYEKEYQHGKNLVDAVHQSGIEHFVYSTLPNYKQLSGGKLSVPHCDLKAELEEYTKSLKIPATFMRIAFYYENFLSFFPLQKDENDNFFFGFPQGDTKLSIVTVEDMGGVVTPVFNHPEEYIGRVVGVVGEDLNCDEYAAILSKVLKQKVYYKYIPRDVYAGFGFPGAEELANMFEVQRLHIKERHLDLIESYGLNPSMQRFEKWLEKNKEKFEANIIAQLQVVVN
jgi:uncharacterized protein YbjT (DUF2867 family)